MKLIKLNAIDSTNDFLKKLSQNQYLENFTVVTAQSQWKGKGQMGSNWVTEKDKNLITSILIKKIINTNITIFDLNITVAVTIKEALEKYEIPDLSIKWPNDIMSGNKKISGILIENNFKENQEVESIIGIGLNINQENFDNLPKASSLKSITGKEYVIEEILFSILKRLEKNLKEIKEGKKMILWEKYHNFLFKFNKPAAFEDSFNHKFMGIIKKVNQDGLIEIILEDESIKVFGIKEIKMLY
ncbi:biotin--[acetyl-CoA-carboxylase] ligase [Flavobacterium oreochromis]|uniref:Biotin--[acetyl-CoA-carboxylase] ligase n=1 Tax=Flavobacterium oreochromis TaxID=2906078 RepID=A0ABW8P5L2_9FLAO|nr:biotin--[acetyl-CoA-carboxylase] ligase [Flavobacterium oreochromis]OWP74299.1 biotin--[acetyl-CoA-carboxylase] ligase [Flavobacterium oreochromis]POR27932.1 biotin--[acetyl-CoA-carboxylase] ligase [Flavobacterium columnare]